MSCLQTQVVIGPHCRIIFDTKNAEYTF